MSDKKSLITRVAQAISQTPADKEVLIGFDGFIDEIIRLVDTRQSVDEFTPIGTITQFGTRVTAAAGKSCNIEMVQQQIKLGGNGPIMANNLVEQGYAVNYCGALGADGVVNAIFTEFTDRCKEVITLADPGYSEALEFDDGKVIMGKMSTLAEVNWESVLAQLPEDKLSAMIEKMDLIGCVNWTMLPNMNSILKGLGGLLAKRSSRAKLFIDLTDPRKRSKEDIAGVLQILKEIQSGVDVILGLNEDESIQVATVLFGDEGDDLTARAQKIRTELGLFQVVVHPTRSAAVASAEGEWFVEGPFTPKPKLTTGAGDNFNAGYCNGLLSGLDPEACLVTGVCSSGFYVRNCRSANREEYATFIQSWADAGCGEMP
ncbi:PfkB family carbohydrate kinase [Kiritimatiellota bacterium B12222]|nr:PfkB family carbohydrate kinase [Kiritimatiellota bacterium B12222]